MAEEQKQVSSIAGRRLGSAWRKWDGNIARHESALNEGPRLYFMLLFLVLLLLSGAVCLAAWFIQKAGGGDLPSLAVLAGGLLILWLPALICLAAICFGTRQLAFPWLAKLLAFPVRALAVVFQPCGVSRDRISSSCICVTNKVTRMRLGDAARRKPMVLLPRCLSRGSFAEVRKVAEAHGCPVFYAGTNAQARERVREYQPSSIIAVACERDLVRGLYDYGRHLPILVIPNLRPHGPCLESTIDMEEFRRALKDVGRATQGA